MTHISVVKPLRIALLCVALLTCFGCNFLNDSSTPPELFQLLEITNVMYKHNTLADIVTATQKAWLRPAGKERWEVEETLSPELGAQVFDLCTSLGYIHEIRPRRKKYDYCCIHGSTMPTMIARMEFAAELERQGIIVGTYVLLTGDRALGDADKTDQFPQLPTNETEGMKLIYHTLKSLEGMRKRPVVFIHAPQVEVTPGVFQRPSTRDTVRAWLATRPKPGSCLFISNQPFCKYQQGVTAFELPYSFTVETVGPAADVSYKQRPRVLLETVSRVLEYDLKNREKKEQVMAF